MKQTHGDLWTVEADLRVITTNGIVRNDGACVMGRGCAAQAVDRFPGINYELGDLITRFGNHVHLVRPTIASFPVKHHWRDQADLTLIERSAHELTELADLEFAPDASIILPRPGCGNGRLSWTVVETILTPILDNRFTIITY